MLQPGCFFMVPYVYFNKICSQPTVQITDFFNKKKFLMQEDLYIYQQPFMLQEVKNLDHKKNTTNWYKSVRSARESTWSKLNSPNKLLIFFLLGMV